MDSKIKITAEKEGERTVLKESYHNAPYKLMHYGPVYAHKHLEMIIMSASPGIMDKDTLLIEVDVKKSAQLKVYTQSFNKLHPMKEGASQKTIVTMQPNSLLHYIPHPVTPFKDSIFKTENEIYLENDATLIWGDIISGGRIFMNEVFEFQRLHSITKIFKNKKLIYTDNQVLMPKEQPFGSMLFFGDYTHQATFIYSGKWAKAMKTELDEILAGEYEDIAFGFTQAADDTILLRAVGSDGELLYNFLQMLGRMCWDFTNSQTQPEEEIITENASEVKKTTEKKATEKKSATKKSTEKKSAKKKNESKKASSKKTKTDK